MAKDSKKRIKTAVSAPFCRRLIYYRRQKNVRLSANRRVEMAKLIAFLVTSGLHVTLCALTDGYFNRLIFRELSPLPVRSNEKRPIYDRKEWVYISVFFLIGIAVVIPSCFAYLIGGLGYVLLYIVVLLLIQWDVIFGRILMGDWFGDLPAMKVPKLGWVRLNLKMAILVRVVAAVILTWAAVKIGVT